MGIEAKRIQDVSLGILGLAELNLGCAYLFVRVGQISIQPQPPGGQRHLSRNATIGVSICSG
jgi:hypothetical protein